MSESVCTRFLSSLQSQDLQFLWGHIVSLLLIHEGWEVGRQRHSEEVVLHWQEDFGIDTVVHPLGLDVVPATRIKLLESVQYK